MYNHYKKRKNAKPSNFDAINNQYQNATSKGWVLVDFSEAIYFWLGIFDYRLKAQGSSHPNETDMQSMCLSFHGVEIVLYSFLI